MNEFLYIKDGGKFIQILFSDILYFSAEDKYTRVVIKKREFLTLQSLCCIEKLLPTDQFCRVHRSYIISIPHTTAFDNWVAFIGEKKIPIAKQYRKALHSRVLLICNESIQYPHLSNYDMFKLFRDTTGN